MTDAAAVSQGDIYWLDPGSQIGSAPAYRRPFVVVQSDLFNDTRLRTIVVCALTSNLSRAALPGNVLLDEGEGGLPRRSVVNVTQVVTADRQDLTDRIGTLSPHRMKEIYLRLQLLFEPISA